MSDKHIDEMVELSEELGKIAENVIGETVPIEHDDCFGFMLLAFSIKQIEHSKSLTGLIKTGNFRDTAIIARVMLEGFAYLQWASQKPHIRAYRWKAFGWVVDFCTIKNQEKQGLETDQNYRYRVESELKKHLSVVLKPKYLETIERDLPPDPYIKNWAIDEQGNTISPKDMLKDIPLSPFLKNAFEKTSKRIHWQPQDLSIGWEGNQATFVTQKKADAWGAYSISILTLRDALYLFIDKFGLQVDEQLRNFDEKFEELANEVVQARSEE